MRNCSPPHLPNCRRRSAKAVGQAKPAATRGGGPVCLGLSTARLVGALAFVLLCSICPARPATATETSVRLAPDLFVRQTLALINGERQAAGLPLLDLTEDRSAAARMRAVDMASSGYFAHVNDFGVGPGELLRQMGVAFAVIGESIARCDYPDDQVVTVVHSALMASDRHRSNILEPRFREIGIGIAVNGSMYYFAIIFTG